MASRRARSRKDAEAAKWVAWASDDPTPWDLSKTTADFDTSDGCVDEMDVSEDEQYGSRVPEQERD